MRSRGARCARLFVLWHRLVLLSSKFAFVGSFRFNERNTGLASREFDFRWVIRPYSVQLSL